MDYNAKGLKQQLSQFQLQGQVKLLMLNKAGGERQNLMGGTYGKKEKGKLMAYYFANAKHQDDNF